MTNICDCCNNYADLIIPYGPSYLCMDCLDKYLKELKDSPTIHKTHINTAKRILKNHKKWGV